MLLWLKTFETQNFMAGELVRDGLSDTFQTSLAIDKPIRKMHLFSGIPNSYA